MVPALVLRGAGIFKNLYTIPRGVRPEKAAARREDGKKVLGGVTMRGDRLTKLRQERHLSQRELGEIILVSGYTISAYELGRSDPSDDIKVRLAEYFDVSVDYLIGLIDEPLSYRRDANLVMLPRNLSEGQKESLRAFLRSLEEQDWVGAPKEEVLAAT